LRSVELINIDNELWLRGVGIVSWLQCFAINEYKFEFEFHLSPFCFNKGPPVLPAFFLRANSPFAHLMSLAFTSPFSPAAA
jgi:hypothetical protein